MSAILQVNTVAVDFGDLTAGTSATVQIVVSCGGDEGLEAFNIVTSDPQFVVTPTLITLDVGESTPLTLVLTPTGVGTVTGTLTIPSNAANDPVVVSLTGRSISPGSQLLSVNPASGFTFPDTKTGTTSAEQLFVLTNTGTVSFNITALACNGQFQLGPTQPSLPFALAPGAVVSVGVEFIPNANLFFVQTNGLVITSGAVGSPLSIKLAGRGVPFFPSFVNSLGTTVVLAAFGPTIQQFAPGQGCEAGCATDRLVNLQAPGEEKGLYNIQVDYEDLGEATLLVRIETRRGDVSEQQIGIGTPTADEEVLRQLFNLNISEEVFHVKLFAITGPISICGYSLEFTPEGEVRKDT